MDDVFLHNQPPLLSIVSTEPPVIYYPQTITKTNHTTSINQPHNHPCPQTGDPSTSPPHARHGRARALRHVACGRGGGRQWWPWCVATADDRLEMVCFGYLWFIFAIF